MQLHVGFLRSLEDSARARAACVRFLQNRIVFFYPERPDIYGQAEQVSRDLGGQLEVPSLSWKYSWIEALFGWHLARRAQLSMPNLRWSLARLWDKALYRIEDRKHMFSLGI